MSIYKELSYDQNIDLINGIQFSVMSAEEIRERSVAEILSTDTYAGNDPVHGGLFDPRMGVTDHSKICTTCEQKNTFCPGHFGHIELAKPLFYIHFFDTIKKILKCVCFKCSKLLIDELSIELQKILNKKISRQKKFEAIYKICSKNKIKRCGNANANGCGAQQPDKITKDNIGKIILEWKVKKDEDEEDKEDNIKVYLAKDILKILSRISDKDSNILGFPKKINRPENLICQVFPVCPPSVRQSVTNDTGQRCHDDLTHKLCDIVKTNNTLKTKIEKGSTNEQVEYWTILLQYHLSTFFDNKIPGIAQAKQRSGRPLRSLTERLKSKEGRIRGNLMGKRVDFSARSVITPDPCISINELGVPIKIAMNLTYPEKINRYNREKLIELIKNGPDKYPGAKYLRKVNENMRTVRLKGIDINKLIIEDGDIVDRHVMNGDFVLFNRQPSLHKMSMMSHKVRVMPYDTFRLNPAVTPSYNADYDGDEMNLHLPQSIQTENELKMLSNVILQIISPRQSKPIVSVVQDVTLGLYRLTKDEIVVNEKQLFNLLMSNTKFLGKIPNAEVNKNGNKKWTGKQLLSEIIPNNVNLINGNDQYDADIKKDDKKNLVIIENGKIKQGVFDKKIYQDRTNGLVHIVYNENGEDEARHLFDNTQKLICDWLVYTGFSVGVSDLLVSKKINRDMEKILFDMKKKVYDIIKKNHKNEFENNSFDTNKQNFENEVNNLLNNAIGKVGKIALSNITDENRMVNMIKSKSKGNPVNMAQMISSLGQQNVDGKRISDGYNDRTLPHYTKYDDGPECRGFVENSFVNGLTPQEFYFHAMGGREGLIDTAVKTSETGYIQRKLIKSMEDCKISYDLTVRNANGSIIQFLYGEDGMNAIKLEGQKLHFIDMNMKELEGAYLFRFDDCVKNLFKKKVFNLLDNNRDWENNCYEHYKELLEDRNYVITKMFNNSYETSVLYPISLKRILNNAKNLFHLKKTQTDLEPQYVLDNIKKLNDELYLNKNNKGNKLFNILIKTYLSPKQVILKHRLNKLSFDYIIEQIKVKFLNSIAHPSEMVGVVAAQSIGEPCTQLTLNTFHSAGISSASQTVRGVPRIKELLSVSKNIKGPSTKVYIKEGINQDRDKCKQILNSLETTYIRDIIKSSVIYYDPDDSTTTIGNDIEFIKIYKQFEDEEQDCNKESPWLLRFEFNEKKMFDLGVTMYDVHQTIYQYYEEIINCYYSDDNANKLIFRIKLEINKKTETLETSDIITELKALEQNIIENIIIKGLKGIDKVILLEKKDMLYDNYEGKFINSTEWFMDTNGNNLLEILSHPNIDYTRTISNDVNEVLEIFGIEAARQVLLNELNEMLSSEGVNYRHISLLVDTMTNKGALLSIDRHGINRSDIGPFAKCSFEETSDMLIKAGVFGEYDNINGVSANIMLGQIPPCGTGDTEILIDNEKLMNINDIYGDEEYFDIDNDMCTDEALSFDFDMPMISKGGSEPRQTTDILLTVK
jgi:DNA-directed RNA polymerase II subunit RPB1